jgi:hypothetical protein
MYNELTTIIITQGISMSKLSMNLIHNFKIAFILTIFLMGCSKIQQIDVIDRSFVTGLPCAAPCWYGLELEISKSSDVVSTLKYLPFVDKSSIQEHSTVWDKDDRAVEIGYSCIYPRKYCGGLLLSDEKLKRIFTVVNFPLTLEESVDRLKEPDSIDYGVCQPELPYCDVILNWENKGISVISYSNDLNICMRLQSEGTIPPETKVTEISYMSKEGYSRDGDSCLKRLPWTGFSQKK